MSTRDWILLILTFLMGAFTGMYLYFTTFVPEYIANPDINTLLESQRVDVQITGEQYGGCARGSSCAAFSLTGDRQYSYDAGYIRNASENIETGDVPRALFKAVVDAVKASDLVRLSAPAQKNCTSWVDGVDVSYSITTSGTTYTLDSCSSQFEPSSELGIWLQQLFLYFEDPEIYELPESTQRGGLGGIIEETLDESFGDY